MSIARAIEDLEARVTLAYDAVESKGGTLPQTKNTYNLPTAISSIQTGEDITPLLDPLKSTGLTIYNEDVTCLRNSAFANLGDTVKEVILPNVLGGTQTGLGNLYPPQLVTNANWWTAFQYAGGIEKIVMPKYITTTASSGRSTINYLVNLKHVDLRSATGGMGANSTSSSSPRIFGAAPIEFWAWGIDVLQYYEFYQSTTLKELYLPNCKNGIGANSIAGCTNLEKITLGLPFYADWKINGTTALTNLKYVCFMKNDNITPVGGEYADGQLATTFPYCETLELKQSKDYSGFTA